MLILVLRTLPVSISSVACTPVHPMIETFFQLTPCGNNTTANVVPVAKLMDTPKVELVGQKILPSGNPVWEGHYMFGDVRALEIPAFRGNQLRTTAGKGVNEIPNG